jgi:hypothetical protein
MPADQALRAIRTLCEATLRLNWREGVQVGSSSRFGYTCPSPRHYPWQFYWDSCFSAIVWRRFDVSHARCELESLITAQRQDGFIGHTIFWDHPLDGIRRFTYNVVPGDRHMTSSIQPPALAWAWRIAVGDPAQVEGITRHHAWLAEHRTLGEDGLLWIVQPDESGLDASPQFDPIWRRQAHDLPGFVSLVRRNRRLGYDLARIAASGGPVCCDVLTNVVYSLSRQALGLPSLTPTILERLYDEDSGLFWPVARPAPDRRLPLTWSALAPLALPDLPEAVGRRLVEEHLLDPARFWLPFPPPSVSADERSFARRDTPIPGLRRYWRGPTWINAAWLIWIGLRRLGYEQPAARLASSLADALRVNGLREYYDPYSGRGMGALGFAWSTLILEMLEPDPRAASSYLEGQGAAA